MFPFNRALALAGMLGLACIASCDQAHKPAESASMTQSRPPFPSQSPLPTLQLGSTREVLDLLDALYREGGMQAVAKWAEQELQPGREFVSEARIGDGIEKQKIYDRSIWLLNEDGEITSRAVLAPLTDETYGESEFFANWSRPRNREPFVLRLRIWRN